MNIMANCVLNFHQFDFWPKLIAFCAESNTLQVRSTSLVDQFLCLQSRLARIDERSAAGRSRSNPPQILQLLSCRMLNQELTTAVMNNRFFVVAWLLSY